MRISGKQNCNKSETHLRQLAKKKLIPNVRISIGKIFFLDETVELLAVECRQLPLPMLLAEEDPPESEEVNSSWPSSSSSSGGLQCKTLDRSRCFSNIGTSTLDLSVEIKSNKSLLSKGFL